jgi:hypothetical protein
MFFYKSLEKQTDCFLRTFIMKRPQRPNFKNVQLDHNSFLEPSSCKASQDYFHGRCLVRQTAQNLVTGLPKYSASSVFSLLPAFLIHRYYDHFLRATISTTATFLSSDLLYVNYNTEESYWGVKIYFYTLWYSLWLNHIKEVWMHRQQFETRQQCTYNVKLTRVRVTIMIRQEIS